jgi:citrate synthase
VLRANGGDLKAAAHAVVGEYRAAKRPIPGCGHPLHRGKDPRAHRLFEVCREAGLYGRHSEAAFAVEDVLPEILGRPLKMNVSAGIPAVLLDAGFPLLALKGVPILARTASLVAHLLEEQTRPIGFVLSGAAEDAISYDGPVPAGFVPGER